MMDWNWVWNLMLVHGDTSFDLVAQSAKGCETLCSCDTCYIYKSMRVALMRVFDVHSALCLQRFSSTSVFASQTLD